MDSALSSSDGLHRIDRGYPALVWWLLAFAAAWASLKLCYDVCAAPIEGGRTAPDFLCFWAAAKGAMAGHSAALYDWTDMRLVIEKALGHGFDGFLPWKYPPTALVLLLPLAAFSLPAAHLFWAIGTMMGYLGVIFRIAGWVAVLAALAAPLSAQEVLMGQNGFATASVLGAALLIADRRPLLAGALCGVLSCKPQLCLLLPLIVVIRCGWRGVAGAAVCFAVLALVSALAFGLDVWRAFFLSLRDNATAFGNGAVPWFSLQSVYAEARTRGLGDGVATAVQSVVAVGVIVLVVSLERSRGSIALRNAAVCAGTVLVTPFVLVWDLTIIGVGMAFLLTAIGDDKLRRLDGAWLLLLGLSTQFFFITNLAVGYLDALLLLVLSWRRTQTKNRPQAFGRA